MKGRTRNTLFDKKVPHDTTKDADSTKDAASLDTNAALGLQQEIEPTISRAFWYYRKAVCWSVLISLANIMESYSIQLTKAFYAFPQFNKKYGFQLKNGTYQVDANWQLGLSLAQFCGLICIDWGIFAAAAPTYAAEVVPTSLRGHVKTYVNLCWVMGRILSTVWPPFLIVATYFAPESPWHLARKGRDEEAERSLDRLVAASSTVINTEQTLSMIHHKIELERSMKVGGSYLNCFKGTKLRRTEIAMVSWDFQILPGFGIHNYTTYFSTLAGLSFKNSFNMSMGTFGMACVGTCLSWVLQTHMGRKTIYLWGLIGTLPIMWIVAGLEYAPDAHTNANIRWAQPAMLMIWFFTYGSTIGPIRYAIASEVGATELRAKTIALSRSVYYVLSIVNSGISPYMLNPSRWDLKGKAAFPGAVFTMCLVLWTYSRLPETKGMTPATLDHLFHEKVPARKSKEESAQFQ